MPLFIALVLAVAVVGYLILRRANEVFFISVRGGRLLLVRGRVTQALFNDLADVVRRARVGDASIRAVREAGHTRLVANGVSDGVGQRLRNTFGSHPAKKLSAAPMPTMRNVGQLLGWTWLAWLLLDRGA